MVAEGLSYVMPLLVVPIAVCSACKLCYHAVKDERWIELAPLILIELNTVYMWTCKGFAVFDLIIGDQDETSFRD
jgi:hypothetical protein